jgi:hypothetical protein
MISSSSFQKGKIALSAWGEIVSDKTTGPLSFLHHRLTELGYSFVEIEDSTADFFISIQHQRPVYKRAANNPSISKKILVNHEPKVVSPEEYRKSVISGYDKVFRWSHQHLQNNREQAFTAGIFWAGSATEKIEKYAFRSRETNSVGMINANKHSFVKGSLYSLRRDVVEKMAQSGIAEIVSLAGINWGRGFGYALETNARSLVQAVSAGQFPDLSLFSRPLRRNPRLRIVGQVEDTLDFLSSLEFAIVIENEATYVSEKIANAVLAGCVPIYCGPKLGDFMIPENVCIQVPPQPELFAKAISSITEDQKTSVLIAGRNWLKSQEAADLYSYDQAMIRLANLIDSSLSKTTPRSYRG